MAAVGEPADAANRSTQCVEVTALGESAGGVRVAGVSAGAQCVGIAVLNQQLTASSFSRKVAGGCTPRKLR